MTIEQKQINDTDLCLLALLRIGLQFESADQYYLHFSAWDQLMEQASMQTVLPIIYHAIMQLPEDKKPPISIVSTLKSETICSVISNERLLTVQDELLAFLKAKNIPCVILKGTSVAIHYPNPELRMQGDIDILVNQTDMDHAVDTMEGAGYQNIGTEHGFHKTFQIDNVRIELHNAFSTVPHNCAGDFITTLMHTAVSTARFAELEKHIFPILSITHQAVSLLLHMQRHITSSGLGLRQLCDWAVFIKYTDQECHQENILKALYCCGLLRFAEILSKTCVLYLGLPPESCPWCLQVSDDICAALIHDFLKSGNFGRKDTVRGVSSHLIPRYEMDAKQRLTLSTLIKNLNKNAAVHFPIMKKVPVLLPIMWIFLPVRYMTRMAMGKRPKHSPVKILENANQRELLYRVFHLFETGNRLHP